VEDVIDAEAANAAGEGLETNSTPQERPESLIRRPVLSLRSLARRHLLPFREKAVKSAIAPGASSFSLDKV
jgi:hypothetical protein